MARLECFTISGLDLWFYSHDHRPPHFHARRPGEWEVRVNFLESDAGEMFSVVRAKAKAIPRAELKRLEEMVARHRVELLTEWENKVQPQ